MAYKASFEPLQITAYPRCGIVSNRYLSLDGILLYYAMQEKFGYPDASASGGAHPGQGTMRVSMPLKIVDYGSKLWYYACSFAEWGQPLAESQDCWNKRLDQHMAYLVDFGGKRGKVIIEKGFYRAYHMPIFYLTTPYVRWYAVGDKQDIQGLLADVTHIGKKTDQGWGRINRWEVKSWPEDWSCWRDGKPMRAIPTDSLQYCERENGYVKMFYGYRPPGYDRRNQAMCVMPE